MKYIDTGKLKAEIERLIKINKTKHGYPAGTLCAVRIEAYEKLLSFIGALSEEPDKEKAAHNYAWEKQEHHIDFDGDEYLDYGPRYDAFIAGAEWKEEQMMGDAVEEKQKDNPKSADSIPEDCVSDAKCEDRWHKVTDSLPDNGRLVLAQDHLGNTLLARYDGEGNWEVSVYDKDDYYCRNTITKWCEIPSGNHKGDFRDVTKMVEQKPVEWNDTDMKEARDNLISVCRDLERGERTTLLPIVAARARYFLEHFTEPKPETVPNPAIPNQSMTEMPDHALVKELRLRGYDMTCKKTIEL